MSPQRAASVSTSFRIFAVSPFDPSGPEARRRRSRA